MPWEVKPRGEEFCVYKKGESTPIKGGCHKTRADAIKQQRALYVKEASENGGFQTSFLVPLAQLSEVAAEKAEAGETLDNTYWTQTLTAGDYEYSNFFFDRTLHFDEEVFAEIEQHFRENTLGSDLQINYDHYMGGRGTEAAGWVKDMKFDSGKMDWLIEFTEDALDAIRQKKWKYFSAEYAEEYVDNQGEAFNNLAVGGALTNRPFLKGMAPLNFSEVYAEVADKEHSEPGTQGPDGEPIPRERESEPVRFYPQTDPLADENNPEGSAEMSETALTEQELRELLGIAEEEDIKEKITSLMSVVAEKERKEAEVAKETEFAEKFPEQATALAELQLKDRKNAARDFANQFSTIEKDGRRYTIPVPVREKLEAAHFDFSEGKLDIAKFSELVKELTEADLVELGERGNSNTPEAEDEETMIKNLNEAAREIVKETEGKVSLGDAISQVASEHPDWYEAYRASIPTGRR